MRNTITLATTFLTTAAFAHSGHGETSAMHHELFSPLNGFEPFAVVIAGLALIAFAAWKRS
jgi:hypothetical protein